MKNVPFDNWLHDWEKTNLVTDKKGRDHYKCKNCGTIGIRIGVNRWLDIPSSTKFMITEYCIHQDDPYIGKWIVTKGCIAVGTEFRKLQKDGLETLIIEPPKDYYNGKGGIWVMGLNEPVKLLWDEFIWLDDAPEKPKMKRSKKKDRMAYTSDEGLSIAPMKRKEKKVLARKEISKKKLKRSK